MIAAELIARQRRRADVKLVIDGEMHVLRWRRGWFADEVLFDDRPVARAIGLFERDAIFGLSLKTQSNETVRLLFAIDPAPGWDDWTGEMRPRGVRLETADGPLIAFGSLAPGRPAPFREAFDRAVRALGFS